MKKNNIVFFLFVFILFGACEQFNTTENKKVIYECGVETTTNDGKFFYENKDTSILFNGGNLQSKKFAHSGEYSIELNEKSPFGLTTIIENIEVGQKYKISVWRKKDSKEDYGVLVASSDKDGFYFKQTKASKTDENGWELLELWITIPPNSPEKKLKVYVWQQGKGTVFFDDIKIQRLKETSYPEYDNVSNLVLYMDTLEYLNILDQRKKAFEKGVLETTDDSWVKSVLFYDADTYKVEMRLKGDWLDHLYGKKWSFRVKIKKQQAWNGMKVFSIQNPNTRHFLDQWIAHQLMQKIDILSPRYGFVPVKLNNTSLGIYAYEEHFVKQLLESKKRREGVILKLTEDAFWANAKKNIEEKKWYNLPLYETSFVDAFGIGKILESETLNNQFNIAQNLLYEYKWSSKPSSEIFDVDKLAKLYAIVDITKMYHAIRWHNQRFYYNPIISKLEIIGYDGYVGEGVYTWIKRPILGDFNPKDVMDCKSESRMNYNHFADSLFVQKYIQYLEQYSQESFIREFFAGINDELAFSQELISKEFKDYKYDTLFLYNNAKDIRTALPEYKEKVKNGLYDNFTFENAPQKQYTEKYDEKLATFYVHAYKEKNNEYKIINYYVQPIELVGVGPNERAYSEKITESIIVSNFNSDSNTVVIKSDIDPKYLFLKVKNQEEIISVPIMQWESPKSTTPLQELIAENTFPVSEYYTVENKNVIFKKGSFKISKTIIIPQGYKVVFNQGTELDFVQKSFFLSYSPVFFNGTDNSKIKIKSSDGTAMGFSVFQADEKSVVDNAIFDNFNTLYYKGWNLTGAVNFYESEVEIKNTAFKNNNCEDALNIIRSDFYVHHCYFENIFSDAFDSDFCTGKLSNTKFEKIGNDAIDFSGSIIEISDCDINNAGDKGISGGEQSYLTIKNCDVNDAQIGYASKDKSEITLDNCKVTNSKYGLVALEKKTEYGAAKIITSNFNWKNIITLHLIEKKSSLNLNGKKIEGSEKNVAKRFY